MATIKPEFTIEYQFKKYLDLVKLKKEQMHPIQYKETRQAFYAAWGQLLILIEDDIAAIKSEMEAVEVLEKMKNEAMNYWNEQRLN